MVWALFIVSASLALSAHGCMPASGNANGELQPYEISSTPKFRMSYSPPTSWTVSLATPTQNQSPDANAATAKINSSINDAFQAAFKKLNLVGPADFKLNLREFVPLSLNLTTNPSNASANEGIVELGAVTQVCRPQSPATTCEQLAGLMPLVLNNTIYVEKGPILSGSQWHDVADDVFISLSTVSGVYFTEEFVAEKN